MWDVFLQENLFWKLLDIAYISSIIVVIGIVIRSVWTTKF